MGEEPAVAEPPSIGVYEAGLFTWVVALLQDEVKQARLMRHHGFEYWNLNNILDVVYQGGLLGTFALRVLSLTHTATRFAAFRLTRWLMGIVAIPATWRALGFMKVVPHLGVLPTALGLVAGDVTLTAFRASCTAGAWSRAHSCPAVGRSQTF